MCFGAYEVVLGWFGQLFGEQENWPTFLETKTATPMFRPFWKALNWVFFGGIRLWAHGFSFTGPFWCFKERIPHPRSEQLWIKSPQSPSTNPRALILGTCVCMLTDFQHLRPMTTQKSRGMSWRSLDVHGKKIHRSCMCRIGLSKKRCANRGLAARNVPTREAPGSSSSARAAQRSSGAIRRKKVFASPSKTKQSQPKNNKTTLRTSIRHRTRKNQSTPIDLFIGSGYYSQNLFDPSFDSKLKKDLTFWALSPNRNSCQRGSSFL